jgi:hypothetical protein
MKEDLSDNASASLFQIGDHCCVSAATSFFYELDYSQNERRFITGKRFDGKKILGQNGLCVHPLIDQEDGKLKLFHEMF